MNQGTLLPVRVATIVPSPFVSADMKSLAIGEDSQDYGLKAPLPHHPEHPMTEALCYHLAAACGLAVPVPVRLVLKDGSEAFGSRFEGGVTQFSKLTVAERIDVTIDCGPWISVLCALDLFLGNNDRHMDNGLFRRSPIDNRWTFIAMDFSRALWAGNFPHTPCATIAGAGNTAATIAQLRFYKAWDAKRAGTVAASLLSISSATVQSWIDGLPHAWHTARTGTLVPWWASDQRSSRTNELLSLL